MPGRKKQITPSPDENKVIDALAEADRLYERYLELSAIGRLSAIQEEDTASYSWDNPLTLVIQTENQHAFLE